MFNLDVWASPKNASDGLRDPIFAELGIFGSLWGSLADVTCLEDLLEIGGRALLLYDVLGFGTLRRRESHGGKRD